MQSAERLGKLRIILKREFNWDISDQDLSVLGNGLISSFTPLVDEFLRGPDNIKKVLESNHEAIQD